MIAEVKIMVEYNKKTDHVELSSRGVDGDGLPLSVYLCILQTLCRMQKDYNNRQFQATLIMPSEIEIKTHPENTTSEIGPSEVLAALSPEVAEVGQVIEDALKKDGGTPVKLKRLIPDTPPPPVPASPPTPKTVVTNDDKYKRYTVEEKTEIAMMYASGMPVATIAEKFGRNANAINILVNRMGVKRGDNIEDTDTPADESDRPKVKKGSALVKPWYLKPQVNIKDKK